MGYNDFVDARKTPRPPPTPRPETPAKPAGKEPGVA